MSDILKGKLGWKGERGYSAYEIAVQNGYEGTEQDWLATLGTSSHFNENYISYTISDTTKTNYALPTEYVTGTFVSAYLNGKRLTQDEYDVDTTDSEIDLDNSVTLVVDDVLEIVEDFLSTNNLPIVDTIDSESTNDTAVGALCAYNSIKAVADDVDTLETTVNGILSSLHPIGSIYLSIDSTNPSTLFGGTWEQIAQGMCLVGVGTGTDINSNTKEFVVGNNDGEYSHTLTISEMPEHNHNLSLYQGTQNDRGNATIRGIDHINDTSNNSLVNNTGGGVAHNIVQPTFGLYIWKRTA